MLSWSCALAFKEIFLTIQSLCKWKHYCCENVTKQTLSYNNCQRCEDPTHGSLSRVAEPTLGLISTNWGVQWELWRLIITLADSFIVPHCLHNSSNNCSHCSSLTNNNSSRRSREMKRNEKCSNLELVHDWGNVIKLWSGWQWLQVLWVNWHDVRSDSCSTGNSLWSSCIAQWDSLLAEMCHRDQCTGVAPDQ